MKLHSEQPHDAYGLSLRDRLTASLKRNVSIGAVYASLERLEKKKLITSDWSDPGEARGGRRKRLYKIDIPGRRAALDFSNKFQRPREENAIAEGLLP
jgi:PadR family transcriptional regulator, regulatory protein PadR